MLLGAREHFVRQLAIIGSHSKVSEKVISSVQSFATLFDINYIFIYARHFEPSIGSIEFM